MKAFQYVTAESFKDATAFLADQHNGETLIKAGGIDVLDRLKERLETPKHVLNLNRLGQAAGSIERRGKDGTLAIGALATLAQVAEHDEIGERFPALAQAAAQTATPQIRNVATVGGNLCQKPRCWYYRSRDYQCLKKGGGTCYAVLGDNRYHAIFGAGACHIVHPSSLALPLLACAAHVRLTRHDDGRQLERVVPLDDFFRVPTSPLNDEHVLEPGELVEEVLIPGEHKGSRSAYVEVREKQSFDWPLASCAVNLNNRGKPRVVLGAVAPIPWRLRNVETMIADQDLDDKLLAKAAKSATEGVRPMSRNGYKVQLVGAVIERALREANEAR